MLCFRCKTDLGKPKPGWIECPNCGLSKFIPGGKKVKKAVKKKK